ncbi:hypothetical protein F4780DRAFT_777181 [Xylariomycetidae sp. FL0641]|nr:hypothetical protein F4780DRAFT_777181 [Xylariomycetidae sp. FL0641]
MLMRPFRGSSSKQVVNGPERAFIVWGVQRGTVVLPKSVTPSRIASNLQVKELPDEVFQQLNGLEGHKRYNVQARWGFDIFEELGDAAVKKVARDLGPENLEKFGKK